MTVSDIYAAARDELNRRAESDKQLSALLEKIRSGKATFEDTAAYNERLSNLLGETLAKYVELPDGSGANAAACIQLLTEQHGNINALLAEVQQAMDSRNGLNLNPIQPKFPAERVQQIAQALEDMTVPFETIQRRANAPVANVSKAFHDAYMKENAKFRSNAGLKCYLNRQSHGQCCAWCSAIVGRYEYGDHPDDIFRRHDNCSCTVTFENGRQRQDVWSKRTWEVPDKDAGADPPTVFNDSNRPAGFQPTVFTSAHAENIQKAVLTFSDISATIEAGNIPEQFRRYVPSRDERIAIIRKGIENPDAVFDNGMLGAYYRYVDKLPDYFDVVMHGNPEAVQFFDTLIDYQTLGAIIVGRKDYQRGTKIRLVSCETGKGDDCVAKYLSEMLGVEVLAPTEKITVTMPIGGKSRLIVQSGPHKHDGAWISFGGDDEL